jgi:hypothetical protein
VSFFLSLLRKDAWVDEDIVFLIIIIIIQTRILRLLSLPPLEKKHVPPLEEEDAFTAKRFSGTKYIRKQRGDDHQNYF